MDIRKIAVGVDFSVESEHALEQAACIAKRCGSKMVLMHVCPVSAPGTGSVLPSVRVWERVVDQKSAQDRLQVKVLAQSLAKQGLAATHFTVEGDPADELAAATDDQSIDLLAVGTEGLTGARLFLLGSVSQRVVRRAHCHVLVARKGGSWAAGPRRILLATDFSAHAEEALRVALGLAADDATIDLVHVWNVPVPAAPTAGHASGEPSLAALTEDLKKDAEASGAQLVAKYQRSRVQLRFEALRGPAASGVIARAKQDPGGYDLIVVGSHGRRGFRRFLLGSVAEKIVRHAPCSALVVHREADRDA